MSDILTPKRRTAAFVVSLVGNLSTDNIALAAGPALPAGQVLAFDATTGEHGPYDPASEKLNEADAILWAPAPVRDSAESVAAVTRLAEVDANELDGLDLAARAALAKRFIIVRD